MLTSRGNLDAGTDPLLRRRGAAPLRGLLPLVVGLILWQMLASRAYPYFPPPLDWLKALGALHATGKLWPAVMTTLSSFFIALVLSIVIGSGLGILLGRSPLLDRLLGPILEIGRTMPAGALVPVAVLIMGYTESMTLSVVTLTSFWPILLNVRSAAMRISQDRLDTARVLRLSWWATQRKILLPSVLPSVQLGTQIAAPVVLIIVLLVEILTQVSGIGREIALAQSTFRSSTVYGLVALTGILGLVVNWIISWTGRLTRNF
ncbi:ABC transmembrane type-1 domain-containing protein [Hyphomicrobiales bacterium]|nr:ABC transmembrane type-1 domain-containing protein [Hyphomicrobiales bacterium]CAH1677311.1 ABC transmembrane type-1 domain-containing protein [Hyphomicrobiales bacterium]